MTQKRAACVVFGKLGSFLLKIFVITFSPLMLVMQSNVRNTVDITWIISIHNVNRKHDLVTVTFPSKHTAIEDSVLSVLQRNQDLKQCFLVL